MIDYSEVLQRIQAIYTSLNPEQQYLMQKILYEIREDGESKTYEDIWLQDYKEIPVDIDTFIVDDRYLGKTNRNGKSVYPHWREVLRNIFHAGNRYNEIVFTGATRIGKSSTGITATAYMLYKLMCLRDPQEFFGKKEVSKFSILFFNLTKDLSKGVSFREFNDTLEASPWFMEHGKVSRSDRDFYYIPEGGKVVIDAGSDAAHALGQQVFVGFCLLGDTKVVINNKVTTLEEASNLENFEILSAENLNLVNKEARFCIKTKYVTDTIKIELEDGTKIEGTPEHKVLLSNGTYKMLKDLTEEDDLACLK